MSGAHYFWAGVFSGFMLAFMLVVIFIVIGVSSRESRLEEEYARSSSETDTD